MKKLVLTILFMFVLSGNIFAQLKPEIEIGSIAALTYVKGEADASPLTQNGGNGTFLNVWDVLLGVQVNDRLTLFGEIQSWRGINLHLYGLSAIYKCTDSRFLNIEIGKFLVPFGNFLKRKWANINPLTGLPLIYEYRTSLSVADVPDNNTALLKVRGQGYEFRYDEANSAASGLRILQRQVYLTGFQLFGGNDKVSYNIGLTNGSLSNPTDVNSNSSVNLIGRLAVFPTVGWDLGCSFAWGAYLDESMVKTELNAINKKVNDFRQRTFGFDLGYSYGHLQIFGEILHNRWQSLFIENNLDAMAFSAEFKYTFLTRFYAAGRFSRIDFSNINDAQDVDNNGRFTESWEFDVDQLEAGLGYRFNRNLLFKASMIFNKTHDIPGGDPADNLYSTQMVVSF